MPPVIALFVAAGSAIIFIVTQINITDTDGRFQSPAFAEGPLVAVAQACARSPAVVTGVFEEFRELHASGVVLAVKGVEAYIVALEGPAEPVFGFGHDEPVVQLRVGGDAVGIGAVREIEGVIAYGGRQRIARSETPFQPNVGGSSRPIQQVGLDAGLLCTSGMKRSRTYETQAENNVQDMRVSLHLQA